MPTDIYDEISKHSETWKVTSGTGTSFVYDGIRNTGTRTYIRRPKPRTEYLAPTPYDVSVRTWRLPVWEASVSGHGNILGVRGCTYVSSYCQTPWNALLPEFSSNLQNGVYTDLRLKVKDQKVNLGQAWAERRMTAGLLADTLTRVAKSYQYLRKGNWKAAQRQLTRKRNERHVALMKRKYPLSWDKMLSKPASAWKQAPASWLEFQYGWRPLFFDVMGSIEAVQTFLEPEDWMVTVKAGRKEEREIRDLKDNAKYLVQLNFQAEGKTFRGVFARVDYHPSDLFLSRLSANTGLTNPALLAWELMPYSFVIDWGVQVGDWISSMDATQYMQFAYGSVTDRRELDLVISPVDARYGANGAVTSWIPDKGSLRKFELHRKTLSSWPLARAPRFKDPTSLTHVANGLSLLTEALKRGPLRVR